MLNFNRSFLALAATVVVLIGCANTGQTPPQFGLKEDWRGSVLRHYAVETSGIPINRRYDELTAEQKAIIHSWYEHMESGDEPPFPAEGLKPILDSVLGGRRFFYVTGELLLLATVSASGEVESVKVYRSPNEQMTTFVSSVLFLTEFKPAVCTGKPCRMEFPFTITFELDR